MAHSAQNPHSPADADPALLTPLPPSPPPSPSTPSPSPAPSPLPQPVTQCDPPLPPSPPAQDHTTAIIPSTSTAPSALTAPTAPAPSSSSSSSPPPPPPPPQTPQTALTFLLVSGRRRTMSFEPDTTVGRVKELVWNTWPSDWQDERPPAPAHLRILHLGKLLQDEDTLSTLSFPTHTPSPPPPAAPAAVRPHPTVVHLSIRPYAPAPPDDPALKKQKRGREAEGGDAAGRGCCQCVVC